MKRTFTITSTTEQGMTIKSITLYLGTDRRAAMKIIADEDGFSDPWIFTVYLNTNKIYWQPGHFWVSRFFNRTVTDKIMQYVRDYFGEL